MNERIKELALQAGLEFDDDEALEFGEEIYYVTKKDMEKFTELIVRECAGIYSKIDNGNQHLGTDDYLEALHKTFFGVES